MKKILMIALNYYLYIYINIVFIIHSWYKSKIMYILLKFVNKSYVNEV